MTALLWSAWWTSRFSALRACCLEESNRSESRNHGSSASALMLSAYCLVPLKRRSLIAGIDFS
jgi:hypothetical protein